MKNDYPSKGENPSVEGKRSKLLSVRSAFLARLGLGSGRRAHVRRANPRPVLASEITNAPPSDGAPKEER